MGKGRGAADTMEGFAGDGPRSNHMGQDVPVLYGTNPKMPWWTMGDVDSFFMLLFDNLSSQGEVTWAKRAPGNEGWRFAIAYSVVCAGLIASHFLQKAGLTDPVIEDKHAAALEKTISKASDASNSGKDFSFGSDEVPPEVKDMSTGHAISA